MNNDLMFSSKSTEWETPRDFFEKYNRIYNLNLDVCATNENTKCAHFFTKERDGLIQDWSNNRCWMNPPYGRGLTYLWVKKAYEESLNGALVVALLPARTDTRWFHEFCYIKQNVTVQFIKGRLKFSGEDSAPFPSIVVVFGLP